LEINNWCQFRGKHTFEFVPGVNLIVGGNGKGKSNLLRAMRYAFSGRSGNHGSKEEDLNWTARRAGERGSVKQFFEHQGVVGFVSRQITTSRCSLHFGEDHKYNSASDVNAQIPALLGITPKVVNDIAFALQGELEALVFQTPAERQRSYRTLFGTEKAEVIRDLLAKSARRIAVDPLDDEIARAETMLEGQIDKPLREILSQLQNHDEALGALDHEAAEAVIFSYQEASELNGRLESARSELTDLGHELGAKRAMHVGNRKTRDEYASALDATRLSYENAKARVTAGTANDALRVQRDRLLESMRRWDDVLAELEPQEPCTKEKADEAEAAIRKTADAISHVELTRASVQHDSCPTCGQAIHNAAELRGKYATQLEELYAQRTQDEQTLRPLIQQRAEWVVSYRTWASRQQNARDSRGRDADALKEIPSALEEQDVTPTDRLLVTNFEQTIDLHRQSEIAFASTEGEVKSLEERHQRATAQMNELSASATDTTPTKTQFDEAQQTVEQYRYLERETAGLVGRRDQLNDSRAQKLQEIEDLKQRNAAMEGARKVVALFDKSQTLLHRECLPLTVTRKYLNAMNTATAKYLDAFRVPFTCEIGPDLEARCAFPSQPSCPAQRLSGGQKVMLAVSLRFAINYLFASEVGVLALDEPTAYLDDDHVGAIMEVLSLVRSYAYNAGMQLIVVTHERQLAGVADQVIEIDQ
jgi:DNA repair exonuclease SbcCD ATPase subunit